MAFGGQFIRYSWLFSITGGARNDVAQFSLNLNPGTAWTGAAAALSSINESIGDTLHDFLPSTDILMADFVDLVGYKWAAIGTDGKYLADSYSADFTAGKGVSGVTPGIIPQSSVVLTLSTGSTFGKGNYGRCYLPCSRLTLNSGTAQASSSTALSAADDMKTWIEAVNTAADALYTGLQVQIMSETGTIKLPMYAGCGTVNDTQRRRRNRLIEDIQYSAITY